METLSNFLLEYRYLLGLIAFLIAFILFLVVKNIRKSRKQAKQADGGSTVPLGVKDKEDRDEKGRFILWSIALALAGVGILWKLYTPGLRVSGVGDWSWDNWLWLLALWGVVAALVALNAEALGATAKMLQKIVAFVVFLMFLGIPGGLWVRDIFLPSVICPSGSTEVRSCRVNTAWSYWIEPEAGTPNGLEICFEGAVRPDFMVANGRSLFRFRSVEGVTEVRYRIRSYKCGGPL